MYNISKYQLIEKGRFLLVEKVINNLFILLLLISLIFRFKRKLLY
jgi:hypothetical protein